jgi:hypothetical protein
MPVLWVRRLKPGDLDSYEEEEGLLIIRELPSLYGY